MELVCPAGSLPALKAAVDNGADWVYLGLRDETNARNFAGLNFDEAALAADLTIRSTVSGFLALALRREDPDTLFFTRRLVMTGDTELGLVVKNVLDAIDWSRLPLPRSWKEMAARR